MFAYCSHVFITCWSCDSHMIILWWASHSDGKRLTMHLSHGYTWVMWYSHDMSHVDHMTCPSHQSPSVQWCWLRSTVSATSPWGSSWGRWTPPSSLSLSPSGNWPWGCFAAWWLNWTWMTATQTRWVKREWLDPTPEQGWTWVVKPDRTRVPLARVNAICRSNPDSTWVKRSMCKWYKCVACDFEL